MNQDRSALVAALVSGGQRLASAATRFSAYSLADEISGVPHFRDTIAWERAEMRREAEALLAALDEFEAKTSPAAVGRAA